MSAAMAKSDNSFDGKRVFVTGADGFIGSHLAEALVRRGARVTALALYNSFGTCGWLDEIADDVRSEMQIELGDVRDGVQMRAFADGSDIIFHLAALIGIPYSYVAAASCVDVNIHGTLNMLEAVRGGAAARLIHTSTSEVYGSALQRPIGEDHPLHGQSPYAASKIGADQMVEAFARSHDIPAVTLRPFNTFGPRQSERAIIPTAIRQMLDPACAEVRLGDLSTTRDFTFVGDTVGAFIALGAAEDADGDNVFGTIAGALADIGQNGLITVVTSGTFPEVVNITGNVTLEAAPGVSANIEAFVQGEPAPESGSLQNAPGIVVDAPANRQVVLRNLTTRNWTDGVRVIGDSRVMIDNVRAEHNTNFGIVVRDNAAVAIVNSRISATGHRVNPGTGDFPSVDFAPAPGDGISYQGSSTGIINSTVVTGSFRFGMDNATGDADALFIRESSAFDNGDDFSDGINFSRFR